MNRPRAFSAALAAILVLAGLPVGAVEWGGTLDNTTTPTWSGSSQEISFQQEDKLALWLEAEFNPRLSLIVQGSYTYSLDRPYLFDVDLLKLQGRFPLSGSSVLDLSLGRFRVSDFSALLFSDNLDGAQASWSLPRANLSLAVGFLGLQLQPVSTVSMSWGDLNSTSLLAPPRLLEMLQVELPELFGRQSLVVAVVAQQDLRGEDQLLPEGPSVEVVGQGGRLSTEYLGVALRGPLAASLYYDLFGYLGTGRMLSYISGAYSYEWIALRPGGRRPALFPGTVAFLQRRAAAAAGHRGRGLRRQLHRGQPGWAGHGVLDRLPARVSPAVLPASGQPADGGSQLFPEAGGRAPDLLKATLFLRPSLGPISDARVEPGLLVALPGHRNRPGRPTAPFLGPGPGLHRRRLPAGRRLPGQLSGGGLRGTGRVIVQLLRYT